jgi:hypothetical protein
MVKLSALHSIELAEAYQHLLKQPQQKDYTLHNIYLKEVNGTPLKQAELVIAGAQTREAIPLAAEFPVHFKKSYFPQSFFTDPQVEFESTAQAAKILEMPGPIGYERTVFRNSFIPGKPWNRHSPFGITPEDRNFQVARSVPESQLIGLWVLLEQVYAQIKKLHAKRFLHGDLQTHNVIVCSSPIRPFIIDYEVSVVEFTGSDEEWEKRRLEDLREFLREAVFVQSVLGRQEGELSAESLELLPKLFENPKSVLKRLKEIGVH